MFLRIIFLSTAYLLITGFFSVSPLWAGGGSDLVDLNRKTSPQLVAKGKDLFVKFCAHCHGLSGDGDGDNAEYLDKEPAELSDEKFQAKKTNHQIFRIIQKGGVGVRKSHLMPVFGHTLSESEIWSLVAYIRSFGEEKSSHPVFLPQGVNTERPLAESVPTASIQSFRKWFREEGEKESSIQAGEKLFRKKRSCFACHQLDEEGGRVGPDLSQSGFRYGPEWVYAWILNPQAYKAETKMPNIGASQEEARFIAAFLNGLHEENEGPSEDERVYSTTSGNSENGKRLFFDPEGKVYCSKCHRVHGDGGTIGPVLDHVGTSRSPDFLLESILDPKAVITAGYSTVLILTKDRKFITGIKKFEDDSGIGIVDKEGKELFIRKDQIKKYKTQKISMMPGNFKELLEVQEVADILAYLKSLKLPEFSEEPVAKK
jgi:putative heme-binding domain-containing protein